MYSMQILRLNERLNFVLPIILNGFNNLTFKAFGESTYFSTRHYNKPYCYKVTLLQSYSFEKPGQLSDENLVVSK